MCTGCYKGRSKNINLLLLYLHKKHWKAIQLLKGVAIREKGVGQGRSEVKGRIAQNVP